MPAFVVTVSTPLGHKNIAVNGSKITTPQEAEAHVQKLQAKKPPKGKQPYAPAGDITAVRPAKGEDFKNRPPQMQPLA